MMFESLKTARGVARSLRIYYGGRHRRGAMDDFYRSFVKRGDLVFDIGAHVGDRIGAFRRLGARVVAAEPQHALVTTLKIIYGRDKGVTIEPVAVGGREGTIELKINTANPTVSTASDDFIKSSQGAPGWQGQSWNKSVSVPMTTLDALIDKHGMPAFMKIDVEGFEAQALAGLGKPVPALSFEFTTIQRDVAYACIERCAALGYSKFNAVLGESLRFAHGHNLSDTEIRAWIAALPADANSGDVYAMR
jgi:FkbM family methyltransferase